MNIIVAIVQIPTKILLGDIVGTAALSELTANLGSGVGAYGGGVVLLTVPFQQYVLKHWLQMSGTAVFVRSSERLRMAQPTQAGQFLSRVALAIVAT